MTMMNVHDAAERAETRAQNAVERATRHGHGKRANVACAVARTYLEGVLNDDERVDEALGITLRRLERETVAKMR
ncbi:hypothetical protein HVTV-2_gp66 [Haloarcula virus HVTV-2]|uniref:Uncharacterized protein n=1 Tax=Haloarcula vallismortis tailed virus 1 TaxID=1262528 RepID=L7THW8_9CAUD|nr:hypothetical protein HVTV1_67 [Haloarcula vallismortis tailed virus 1]AGC34436.1 hypothetical protein HVTV1_67 [Haloarcula vallismortis tailed virus 1]UBF22873.1 hypothetical protein HVTV-2_gp66 [Haloarcula virus HVTV-2]